PTCADQPYTALATVPDRSGKPRCSHDPAHPCRPSEFEFQCCVGNRVSSVHPVERCLMPVLSATPPFDFTHSLRFLGQFAPAKGEQSVSSHSLTKAVLINNQVVAFRVSTTDEPNKL